VLVLPYAFRALESGLTGDGPHDPVGGRPQPRRRLGHRAAARRAARRARRGLSAALLTVALVLGEFTLASLLNFPNLQVAVNLIGKRDAALSIAVSLAALLLAFALLLALSMVAGRRRTAARSSRCP
jgi:putative spermidine/putrescine transport system permease protein